MDYAKEIIEMIKEELYDGDEAITQETSLFKGQVLDSLSLTMLIAFLEDTYDIKVKALDIIYENFDTVNNMVAYINKVKA